jgi:hypothetical protein
MDVIAFGLSLSLNDHETIKDCVNVYCEWLTCTLPQPRISVPKPIIDDPNLYTRKIIAHLHNLFVPRQGEGKQSYNRTTQNFFSKHSMHEFFNFSSFINNENVFLLWFFTHFFMYNPQTNQTSSFHHLPSKFQKLLYTQFYTHSNSTVLSCT